MLTNSTEKEKEKSSIINQIQKSAGERIAKIYGYVQKNDNEELFQPNKVREIQTIINDIKELMKIDFVKAEHDSYYSSILVDIG